MNQTILNKIKAWKADTSLFVKECFKHKSCIPSAVPGPSSQQNELLANFEKQKRITIRSGHGTGKDTSATWCILKFFLTRPYAKVVCTAPTSHQLQDVLWSELAKWIRLSVFSDELIIQKDKIFHKEAPKEWWIRYITPQTKASKEEQAETLAGIHGDHLLWIVDEASGVPDPVFLPIEGSLTQADNRVLLIGNMTKNSGYFYDTHFKPGVSSQWFKLHWDSRKSTNVSEDMVNFYRLKYGEDSSVFAVRVAGDPPAADDKSFIPLAWAMQCIGNKIEAAEDEPVYLGIDVARFGNDKSIILPRKGLVINPWSSHHKIDTALLSQYIEQDYAQHECSGAVCDEIGVGGPVVDFLRRKGYATIYGVNVAWESSDKKKYHKLRDELWSKVKDKCERGQYSFPDQEVNYGNVTINIGQELCNELASPYYDFDNNGGVVIESKKAMKLRGIESPNIADALCLTEYFYETARRVWSKDKESKVTRRLLSAPSRFAWMAV